MTLRVEAPGTHFEAFCRKYIVHTKGRWAGQPFELESFQRAFVNDLFETDENGRRVYTEALLGIPRKNGKSTLGAALALYFLCADGEAAPEVYVAASARDQARVIYDQSVAMVEASPRLLDFLRPHRYDITCPQNGGVFRVLSSDAPKQHGLSPSAVIIDELWAHEDGELYLALTSGSGAREQPVTVTITTAGWNEESVLGRLYERAMKLPNLEKPNPYLTVGRDRASGFLFHWWAAPLEADIDDPAVWKGANPASWISEEYLRREREKPSMNEADFRRLHLGQWTAAEQTWLPAGAWEACRSQAQLDPALPVAVGIDLGQTFDAAAVVVGQRQGEQTVVRSRVWENPYAVQDPRHRGWSVNTEEIRAYLRELHKRFPQPAAAIEDEIRPGPAFCYDPWHFRESAEMLEADGFAMVEFPQFASYMVPASTTTYELVVSRRLAHDGDPVLARHVAAATSQLTPRGWRISKPKKGSRKNDAAVALVMAVHQAQQAPPEPKPEEDRTLYAF